MKRIFGRTALDAAMRTIERIMPAVLLVILALLLVKTSFEKRLTYDEPFYLEYGLRFLTESPPIHMRERLPMTALSALPCLARGCRTSDLDLDPLRRLLVRAPTMGFALGLGWLLHSWVAATLGRRAAFLTLVIYVFNPTVLAHGKQVTTDMATAFFTAASLFAAWHFARRPGWKTFVLGVLATAGAALSKFTALYLLMMAPALVASCHWRRGAPFRTTWRRLARGVVIAGVFVMGVLLAINAVYRFSGTGTRMRELPCKSGAMRRLAALNVPLPVPSAYLQGFDFARDLQEKHATSPPSSLGVGPNYILGRRNQAGVWYAFPLMLLLKTPLAFFALLGWGLAWGVERAGFPLWRFWLAPAVFHIAYFSLGVSMQIGVRYLLPALVLLLPAAGAAARANGRKTSALLLMLSAWYVLSSISYLPHPMCYFNELIGRRIHAYRYLADSNLDWEDRGADIARYREQHSAMKIVLEPREPQAGYVLVSVNRLLGVVGENNYKYLRRLEPIDHVGYSYLLFNPAPADLPKEREIPAP